MEISNAKNASEEPSAGDMILSMTKFTTLKMALPKQAVLPSVNASSEWVKRKKETKLNSSTATISATKKETKA